MTVRDSELAVIRLSCSGIHGRACTASLAQHSVRLTKERR
jgi:hypothetical protein